MPGTSTALATFSCDLAGRMTRGGLSAATDTTMAFDAFDRVRVVDEPGSGVSQHRYDAAGERATTVWADGRIERYFGGGLTQREGRLELHVGLGGARVVARVNVPELPDGTASIRDGLGGAPAVVYLHQGVGHGPTVVTDASGAVIEERVFEPYGTPLWVDADYELERLGYNGKAVDPSTGWSDHGARWHATRFARWLSVDPPLKGPGGLVEHGLAATPYGFVAGNPVMFWDPDGNAEDKPDDRISFWAELALLRFGARHNLNVLDAVIASQNLRPRQVEVAGQNGTLRANKRFLGAMGEILLARSFDSLGFSIVWNPAPSSLPEVLKPIVGQTVPDLVTFWYPPFLFGRKIDVRIEDTIGPYTFGQPRSISFGDDAVTGVWEVTTSWRHSHIRDRAEKVATWALVSRYESLIAFQSAFFARDTESRIFRADLVHTNGLAA